MELLVRAHECHTLACNMEGIAAVLRNGRVLTSALAETRDYMLMVIAPVSVYKMLMVVTSVSVRSF